MRPRVLGTLLGLLTGAVWQRMCQVAVLTCVARNLGVERTGEYVLATAIGAVLAVLAGAGVRGVVAREVAQDPARAGVWVRAAVRATLRNGVALAAIGSTLAVALSEDALFWSLCCFLVLPLAFDLKGIVDANARTGREVLLESAATTLHVGLVIAWVLAGSDSLAILVTLQLVSRCLYAMGAVATIRRLPGGSLPSLRGMVRKAGFARLALVVSELVQAADVWLVASFGGCGAAGVYAVAHRIAAAAALPSAQLARLLQPHFLHATVGGDPARTALTALRSVAWATLPVAAGGIVVAEPLCALFGSGFAEGAPVLRLLLLAIVAQHMAWQCSLALFAAGRDRAYAATLSCVAATLLLLLPPLAALGGAVGAALATTLAQLAYFTAAWCSLRRGLAVSIGSALAAPGIAALSTFVAASVAVGADWLVPLPQIAAGATAFAITLWVFELKGRVSRVGEGLARASGFGR